MGTHTVGGKFNPQKYVNLVIAVAGAIGSAIFALGTTSGHLNAVELINLAIAGVGAFNVWYVTETADNPKGKSVIAFVTAVLVAAQSAIGTSGHLRITEWLQILVAALTATGLLGVKTTAVLRRALPASYANNTYVVDVGTKQATSEVRPVPMTAPVALPTPTQPVAPVVPDANVVAAPRPDDSNAVAPTVEAPTVQAPVTQVPPAPFIGGVPA